MNPNEQTRSETAEAKEHDEPIQPVPTTEGVSNDDIAPIEPKFNDSDNDNVFQEERDISPYNELDDDDVFIPEDFEIPTSAIVSPVEKDYNISANIDPQSWSILRGEFLGFGLNEQTSFPEFIQKLIENRQAAFKKEEIKVENVFKEPESIAPPTYTPSKKYPKTGIILAVIGGVLVLGFVIWAIWKIRKNAAFIKTQNFFEVPK